MGTVHPTSRSPDIRTHYLLGNVRQETQTYQNNRSGRISNCFHRLSRIRNCGIPLKAVTRKGGTNDDEGKITSARLPVRCYTYFRIPLFGDQL
jgi:hypothetical protein